MITLVNCELRIYFVYYGTSERLLYLITYHISDCKLKKRSCGLAEDVIQLNHVINFVQGKILDRVFNKIKPLILEMNQFSKNVNNLNKKSAFLNLIEMYNYILTLEKQCCHI